MADFVTWQITMPTVVAALTVGYLLGSVPFGLVLTRAAGLGDIRQIGSGNIGATNVWRTGDKKLAIATFFFDGAKGAIAVLILYFAFGTYAGILAGVAAFLGHLFPIWLGFRGGKGVATYIGILLALAPMAALLFSVVWLTIAVITRYSSLSALAATLITPVVLWVSSAHEIALVMAVMTLFTWLKHRTNIGRLIGGTETKIGVKTR